MMFAMDAILRFWLNDNFETDEGLQRFSTGELLIWRRSISFADEARTDSRKKHTTVIRSIKTF
jgi:hypothetical protein